MLRFLLCLTASMGVVISGYFVGYGDATTDAATLARQVKADARHPAAITGIQQCGDTVMVVMSRGDGSQVLMTEPDAIRRIAKALPDGRSVLVELPCHDDSGVRT